MRGKVADFFDIQASKAPPVWTCRGAMVVESMLLLILLIKAFVNNLFWFPQSPAAVFIWPAVVLVINVSVLALALYILIYILDLKLFKRHLLFTRILHLPLEMMYGVSWQQYRMAATEWVLRQQAAKRGGGAAPVHQPVAGWSDPTGGAPYSDCFPGLVQPYRRRGNLDPLTPPCVDESPANGSNVLKQLLRNTLDRLVVIALGL
jgi:hypothetical protein